MDIQKIEKQSKDFDEEVIKQVIVSYMNFPKQGINFRDITPIFQQPSLVKMLIKQSVKQIREKGLEVDCVAGLESRGFLLGVGIAQKLGVSFVLIRKEGKLPGEKCKIGYGLEYGENVIEIHKEQIKQNWKVLIHDDLLATGGTAEAAAKLILLCKATVIAFHFIIHLLSLNASPRLLPFSSHLLSLLNYHD